jgi:hypothetical protein
MPTARLKYIGSLPTGSNEIVLAELSPMKVAAAGLKWLVAEPYCDQDGSFVLYEYIGGAWTEFRELAVSAVTGETSLHEFYIENRKGVRLSWKNGGTNQTSFEIAMAVTSRRDAAFAGILVRYGFDAIWDARDYADTIDTSTSPPDVDTWESSEVSSGSPIVATGSTAKPALRASNPLANGEPTVDFVAADSEFLQVDDLATLLSGAEKFSIVTLLWGQPQDGASQYLLSVDNIDLALVFVTNSTFWVRFQSGNQANTNKQHSGLKLPHIDYDGIQAVNDDRVQIYNWGVDIKGGVAGTIPTALSSFANARVGRNTLGGGTSNMDLAVLAVKVGGIVTQHEALANELAAIFYPYDGEPPLTLNAAELVTYDGSIVIKWGNLGSLGGEVTNTTGSNEPGLTLSDAAYNDTPVLTFDGTQWFDDADAIATYLSGASEWSFEFVGELTYTASTLCGFSLQDEELSLRKTSAALAVITVGAGNQAQFALDNNPHAVLASHTAGSSIRVWVDGSEVSVTDIAGSTDTTLASLTVGSIGRLTSGTEPLVGKTRHLSFNLSAPTPTQAVARTQKLLADMITP